MRGVSAGYTRQILGHLCRTHHHTADSVASEYLEAVWCGDCYEFQVSLAHPQRAKECVPFPDRGFVNYPRRE
jgi:hypothetical protein